MIPRALQNHALRLAGQYPVVTLTGPRQSGKTTLCRATFPDKPYINLEDPDTRQVAQQDPRRLLAELPDGAVLDEIQRVPELPSYLQGVVDECDMPGMFILTGSHHFELMEHVSQSLAGRTALLTLLPFSYNELYGDERVPLDNVMLRGFYPRIHDKGLNPTEALAFYVGTYLERDLRNVAAIRSLAQFERFLRLGASWSGQILNLSAMANDIGVDQKTIRSWLSILQATYILFLVQPHHENLRKRLRKAPKLYFFDVGLAVYLLGIKTEAQLAAHPLRGAMFETFIAAELLKRRLHRVSDNNLFYFRDHVGNEVDLILEQATSVVPVEIKSASTFGPSFLKGLRYYSRLRDPSPAAQYVIYAGERRLGIENVTVLPYHDLAELGQY